MSWMHLWQHEGLNLGPAFNFKCCQIQTTRCTVNGFSFFFPGSTESHQKTNSWWLRKTAGLEFIWYCLNSFGNEGERIVSLDISFDNTKTSKLWLNKRFLFTWHTITVMSPHCPLVWRPPKLWFAFKPVAHPHPMLSKLLQDAYMFRGFLICAAA